MSDLSPPPPKIRRYGNRSSYDGDDRGTFRALVEAFVSLFIAVLLFRTFAAEGYMISTGSMAPSLLGFHKRVVCPTCRFTFPFGTAYDSDEDSEAEQIAANRSRAICPNCGQQGIDVTDVPKNHGDQLLVNKQAYVYTSPRRWDVVVFRNPAKPTEAYVKRAVGLPGERIQVVEGDIVIDGNIARKTFPQQLSTRILVHDHNYHPTDDETYRSHWRVGDGSDDENETNLARNWKASGRSFVYLGGDVRRTDKSNSEKTNMAWLEYRHWLRAGGQHETSVKLNRWPDEVDSSKIPDAGLKYRSQSNELSVTGALPFEVTQQMLEMSTDEPFREAVSKLYEESHVVPITDQYGYNPAEEAGTPSPVRDVMLSAFFSVQGGTGEFAIEMTNGSAVFSAVFDVIRRQVNIYTQPLPPDTLLDSSFQTEHGEPVATARWPAQFSSEGGTVDVSLFDKQFTVAINGKAVTDPIPFELIQGVQPPKIPVRIGAKGLEIKVAKLKIYRDIYYTDTRSRHAVNRPFELGEDQYFVLGDNSPVSHDSRRWEHPPVLRSYMIGKPFLVHLPSKPGNLRVGNKEFHLRMPDWERIRLLK